MHTGASWLSNGALGRFALFSGWGGGDKLENYALLWWCGCEQVVPDVSFGQGRCAFLVFAMFLCCKWCIAMFWSRLCCSRL